MKWKKGDLFLFIDPFKDYLTEDLINKPIKVLSTDRLNVYFIAPDKSKCYASKDNIKPATKLHKVLT
jgi:hypothetical protein